MDPLFQLCLASRDLYPDFARQVAEESGSTPPLRARHAGRGAPRRGGGVARPARLLPALLGLAAERLGGEALRRMEPALHLDWSEALYLPRDWTVDNVLLVRGLALSATAWARAF